MDIIRDTRPTRKKKRYVQGAVGVVILVAVTLGLRNLSPAAPSVDAAIVWVDTVAQGDMFILRRGPGTLVPEQMRWITAVTSGRVEQILALIAEQALATVGAKQAPSLGYWPTTRQPTASWSISVALPRSCARCSPISGASRSSTPRSTTRRPAA